MNKYQIFTLGVTFIIASNFGVQAQSTTAVFDAVASPCFAGKPDMVLSVAKDWECDGCLTLSFMSKIKELFKATIFVETGTFLGETTLQASSIFEDVYSVELSPTLYQNCANLFKSTNNIHLHEGDSALFLEKILPSLKGITVFWLDAHFSNGPTAYGAKETPIIEELIAIKNSQIRNGIIMIDDMRYFFKNNLYSDWPSFTKTCELILDINPHYKIALFGDVLIAFPQSANITVSPLIWACTLSRLYDENNKLPIDSTIIDQLIAQSSDEELEALQWLHTHLSNLEDRGFCDGSFNWWNGLALLYRGNAAALAALKIALYSDTKKARLALLAKEGLAFLAKERVPLVVNELHI